MIETESSRINSRVWGRARRRGLINGGNSWPVEPIRERRRCPAIILAVSRILKVIGRMISLMDSMITMKGIRIRGVP